MTTETTPDNIRYVVQGNYIWDRAERRIVTKQRLAARLNALEACAEAGRKLQAEYKAEEELHGFPFNMALRQAHADHAAALARLDALRP